MGFQSLGIKAVVGSVAALSMFVAINTVGIASAGEGAEQCGPWSDLKLGPGQVKVCASAIGKTVIGKASLAGGATENQHMFIELIAAHSGNTVTYEKGQNEIIVRNLRTGDYQVSFCEDKFITCQISPVITVH